MGQQTAGTPEPDRPSENRLDSWKEIAAYLERDITTVQRWEKREGMPVHRHLHDTRGSVYAVPAELEAWLESRKIRLEPGEQEPELPTGDSLQPGHTREKTSRVRPRLWLALSCVAVAAALTTAYVLSRGRISRTTAPKIRSLAVLPLKNMSAEPGQDYLSDGLTDALIGRLAGIQDLRVISRTSVMQFKNPLISVPQIAKKLGVDAILEGSLVCDGNRVRVTAQLIRGSTDEHLWSQTYDRDLGDVLALESDIAQSVAQKVKVTVTGEERSRLAAVRYVSPEVYESYLKGRLTPNNTKADVERSISYYQDAIHKDPSFAPAYVGLAASYDRLGGAFVGVPPPEVRPRVISAARKALELDPNLADAHALLAEVYQQQWQWDDAQSEYKRALELNPNNSAAQLGYATWLMCHGQMDEALLWSRHARELDPLGVTGITTGLILFQARRYPDAIRELRSVISVRPGQAGPFWLLGFALIANHQPEEAIPLLEKAASGSSQSAGVIGGLVRANVEAGHRAEALRWLNILKRREKTGYVPAAAFVDAYLALGERDQAFAWFERAYQEQADILQWLKVHPFFDPVRDDPRFKDLLHRVGLGQSGT